MKKSIPLDNKAVVVGLFVAVIVALQQIAVIVMTYYFKKAGVSAFGAEVFAYVISIFVLIYYINKAIDGYRNKKK